jgi:hypothetical protein
MEGNPMALVFLLIAILFGGLTLLLAVLQRRSLRDQSNQMQELLAEARQLVAEERANDAADSGAGDDS